MLVVRKPCETDRLVDMERTLDFMDGQLREMRWDLNRVKKEPLPVRLWKILVSHKGRQEFMSAVCNRHARPNTKVVSHADPRP